MRKLILLIIVIPFVAVLAACGGHSTTSSIHHSMTPIIVVPTPTIAPVVKVASEKDVAAKVGCINYVDLGPAPAGTVLDHGNCWIGSAKYGIDTFANQTDRDAWLQMASGYGVVAKWETPTTVIYPSTN
jgi:hypothetical protein